MNIVDELGYIQGPGLFLTADLLIVFPLEISLYFDGHQSLQYGLPWPSFVFLF